MTNKYLTKIASTRYAVEAMKKSGILPKAGTSIREVMGHWRATAAHDLGGLEKARSNLPLSKANRTEAAKALKSAKTQASNPTPGAPHRVNHLHYPHTDAQGVINNYKAEVSKKLNT